MIVRFLLRAWGPAGNFGSPMGWNTWGPDGMLRTLDGLPRTSEPVDRMGAHWGLGRSGWVELSGRDGK